MQSRSNPQTRPVLMLIAGALIAAVGGFLTWFELDVPEGAPDETYSGTDLETLGYGTLIFAIAIVVLGIIQWFRAGRAGGGGRGLAISAFVLSIFILIIGIYSIASPADALTEFAAQQIADDYGLDEDDVKVAIEDAIEAGQVDVSPQLGAFVQTGGSLLAFVGGLLGIVKGRRKGAGAASGVIPRGGVPGATGPGTPQTGTTSTPADPTGSTAPPPGTPPGGPMDPPRP